MAIQKTKEPSKVDAALQRFAEMLIKRMEEMQKDWHKGWIGGGSMFGLPQNISGRTYEGSNAFLLFLHTAENGYKAPVYMTYGQLYKEGAHVLKGEKAVPVFKWGFSIKDKDGKKVTEEEFDNMTDDEKKECKRRPFLKIYPEFNIDQTNMSEVNKEKYDAVVSQFRKTDVPTITDGMYVNKAIDRMMEKQEWVCKIQYDKEEKGAYYSPAKDIVVLPTKAQFRIHPDDPEECFKDGQEYYGTALHEMAHSTGHPSRLDRLKPAAFGSPEYAKEELVAELTSAMVGNTLGFDRRISDNNVAYLQNWTSALRKEPKFIVTVMADVNKASRIIIENIDKQRIALGEKPLVQGALDGVEEKVKNEQQFEEIKADQKKEDPREAVAKEWDSLAEKPTVEMESGDVLPVEYNKEKDTLDVLITNEAGKQEVYSTNYDHDRSIEENVGHVWEAAYSNINAKYEDVSDDRTRQIAHRIDQAKSIITAYHTNIENAHGENYLFEEESAHKIIPREEYAKSVTQEQTVEPTQEKMDEIYYFSHTYLQSTDSREELDNLVEKQDYDSLLYLTREYDQGDALSQSQTYKNATKFSGDDILAEDDNYAVVYNSSVGGTYDLMRKVTKQDIIDNIERYGLESDASDDVKKVAYENIAKQFSDIKSKIPAFTMPNEDVLYFQYNQESNKIEVGTTTNAGLKVDQTFDYDVDRTLDSNLENVYEQLSELPEYQKADEQEEELDEELEPESLDENISLNEDSKEKSEQDKAQIAQKFTDMPIPYFTMPNGEKLDFHYNQDTNNIVVEKTMDNGEKKNVYQHPYNHELTTAENMSDIYAVISQKPEYQKAEEKENVVAHEDSNVQTNVEGLAEDIAETGVPMAQAEKEAKTIVDDKQHEDFHEAEDKKQEHDQAKAEKAQAEKEKQQQESKKDEDKPSKGVAHAAILLGALAAAKENNGVWMNKESKSNAEFIFAHTPVTAYNNIMMNLQSDQKGYRTNVFTSFNNAQKNGVAVKQGEKATPFNWTQWDYQNLTDKNDIISNKKYEKLSDEEKKMYGKHASRLTQYIYNIDQTTYPAVGGDQFVTLLKEKGAQQESLKPSTSASFLKQFDEIKAKHPDVIVIMRKDDSYEIYKSDAKKAAEATHLPVIKQEIEGNKIDTVSFSHTMLDVHLPNIIRAGHRVAICDQLEDPKLVKSVPEGKAVLDRAYSTAKTVAKQEGIKYERVMVIQDAKYDKADDKIEVSGMIDKSVGSERLAALQKANDIYRAVVAATGTENRLDRSGRNSLLPEDDAKHEKLVQELAAGVLMARQGLPATLSKESQKLIPYWERELKENPKMVGVIERDVNNAVETIDNLIANRKVDYKAIRGQLPPKMITDKAENYSLAADLAKLPSIDTKEVVVIRDRKANKVDVILPAGASVEANNEVPGMRKDRISIALKKEGFDEVKFYNAGGSLGLNKPNSYFEGKDVSLNQLKQYQLVNHKTIEVAQQPKQENKVEIEHFRAIKDDYGRWAFYIKPKNEPQFSVYPPKEHMNKYFSVRNTSDEKTTRAALANKWYEVAKQFPDVRVDIVNPHPAKDIDMSRIVNPTITKSAQDPKVKLVFATIDGERHHAPVNETQWQRMWLADNMAEYKKAVAAVVFEPVLRKGMESQQTQSKVVKETEKVEVKEAPEPEPKQEEQEKQSTSRGVHI